MIKVNVESKAGCEACSMRFFALNDSAPLGAAIARAGGFALDPHEERAFEAGEHKTRPLVSVRGEEVFILSATNGDRAGGLSANDRLVRLLFFAAACRDHGAARVTVLAPYLAYARKDRRTQPHDPVNARYVAQLFEAVGVGRMVVLDVHNPAAFENGFRCETLALDTRRLFAEAIAPRIGLDGVVILSPDGGGVKRAAALQEAVGAVTGTMPDFAFMEKRRAGGVVSGSLFAGEVAGRQVFVVDDMIVGGGTMLRAALAAQACGAASVHLLATHALMDAEAAARLADPAIADITVTDAAGVPSSGPGARLQVLSVAPLLGRVIAHLSRNESIAPLLDPVPR